MFTASVLPSSSIMTSGPLSRMDTLQSSNWVKRMEGAELLIPVVSGGVALTLGIGVGHIHTRIGQHLLAGLKGGLAAAVHMNVHVTQQILHTLDEHLTTLVAVLTGAIVGKPVDEHVGLRFELSRESELLNFHLLLFRPARALANAPLVPYLL